MKAHRTEFQKSPENITFVRMNESPDEIERVQSQKGILRFWKIQDKMSFCS